jgi:hypothetical protein
MAGAMFVGVGVGIVSDRSGGGSSGGGGDVAGVVGLSHVRPFSAKTSEVSLPGNRITSRALPELSVGKRPSPQSITPHPETANPSPTTPTLKVSLRFNTLPHHFRPLDQKAARPK